jgi:formiminotetrahydrofolate cyclodeaminase
VQYESQLSTAIALLTPLREDLKSAIDADAESYNSVMKAYKETKNAADQRSAEAKIEAALKQATAVPLSVAQKAYEVRKIAQTLGPITNPNMASDLTTSLALARAAITGALANVDINLASIKDATFSSDVRQRVESLKAS